MSASVITAGTTLARSSTKSIRPDSIFSSKAARVTSSVMVFHRATAAGERIRIESPPVVPLGGRIHLQKAGYGAVGVVRDRDSLVPLTHTLRVAVVRQKCCVTCELEDLVVPTRHPMATMGVGPRDGAGSVQLMGELVGSVHVVRTVPVEVDRILFVSDGCHQRFPLVMSIFIA